jgi:NAD(P)-dependent dehydrogenase (short-subunit alcohol dehydrogenase family)
MPGSSVYGSLKAAIETLTRYLAKELGPKKIRANVVAPGAIETDFGGGRVRDNKDINDHVASITALGRVGLPDDIGGVVAFLCTDEAWWINGQRIEVSGGQAL